LLGTRASGARLDVADAKHSSLFRLVETEHPTDRQKDNAPAVSLLSREDPEHGCLRDTPWLLLMLGVVSIEKPNYTESKGTEYLVNTGHISSISSN